MNGALYLTSAILVEIFSTAMLKASEQFTKLLPTILMAVGYLISFYLLSQALKTIPLGIAYAIWSAVGIVLTAIVGAVVFKEMPDWATIIGISLIVLGVLVINIFSKTQVH